MRKRKRLWIIVAITTLRDFMAYQTGIAGTTVTEQARPQMLICSYPGTGPIFSILIGPSGTKVLQVPRSACHGGTGPRQLHMHPVSRQRSRPPMQVGNPIHSLRLG